MDATDEAEKLKFFNFLKHYDLQEYHESFLRHGVRKVSHLKHTTEKDLKEIGLHGPEIARLKRKLDENFSTFGKIKKRISRKDHKFDGMVNSPLASPNNPLPQSPLLMGGVSGISNSPILISSQQIELGNKIGEGTHGSVYEAHILQDDGSKVRVAVKCISAVNEQTLLTQFMKEAESMVQLAHPNIIKLYGISIGAPLMMVEELAPFGNLNAFLKKFSDHVNLGILHKYTLQVADAMSYLEAKKIVHRDLATRNILLMTHEIVKLGDFGLARKLADSGDYQLTRTDIPLPTAWMSPEAISKGIFSSASDVWSFGVVVWELYTKGERPWDGCRTVEIKDRLETGERLKQPVICSAQLYRLMNECWALEPKERPTFAEVFKKLQEPQYQPDVAVVTVSHTVEGDIELKKDDMLYVLDRRRKDLWVGMTLTGQTVSFRKDYVRCDGVKTKYPQQNYDFKMDINSVDHVYSSADSDQELEQHNESPPLQHRPSQQQQLNLQWNSSYASTYHYETRDNNPGVDEHGEVQSDELDDLYIRMRSRSSILDTPTNVNLPPPIVPTAQALERLIISSETKDVVSEPNFDNGELNGRDKQPHNVDVEATYCFLSNSYYNNEGKKTPPPIPPRRSRFDSSPDPQAFEIPPKPTSPPPEIPSPSDESPLSRFPSQSSHKHPVPSPRRNRTPGRPVSYQANDPFAPLIKHEDIPQEILKEFPHIDREAYIRISQKNCGDITSIRRELRVQQLMGMAFPYIEEKDCYRALEHCQDKSERAAAWLLELSETISARKR